MATVAVTGASGFIGSHLCQNLVQHGYHVRACVRDKHNEAKTQHLVAMNDSSLSSAENIIVAGGSLELFQADMMIEGSYDEVFDGCDAVFHVAGNFGTDRRWLDATNVPGRPPPIDEVLGEATASSSSTASTTVMTKSYDQGVFDSYIVSMKKILDSIARSKTVKRLIYTSSGCAGSVISELDNDDEDYSIEDNAYGKGKVECEKLIYSFGQQHDIICCSSCPTHVLGPILAAPWHDMMYQHRLGVMFGGKYCLDMSWDVCDVRDVAETQRLMYESSDIRNGARYFNGSAEEDYLTPTGIITLLREQFPEQANQIADAPEHVEDDIDDEDDDDNDDGSSSSNSDGSESSDGGFGDGTSDWALHRNTRWANPEVKLGLRRHAVADTVRDTIVSMQTFNMINRKDMPIRELRNFYQVAEMDDCEEEMEYLRSELLEIVEKT
jgi:nucleoside-diphosphate-sugar epimerase